MYLSSIFHITVYLKETFPSSESNYFQFSEYFNVPYTLEVLFVKYFVFVFFSCVANLFECANDEVLFGNIENKCCKNCYARKLNKYITQGQIEIQKINQNFELFNNLN